MLTDHVLDTTGDTTRVRVNVQAMHLWRDAGDSPELQTHFVAGGVMRAGAERTSRGWRLSELSMDPVWRTGSSLRMLTDSRA